MTDLSGPEQQRNPSKMLGVKCKMSFSRTWAAGVEWGM